MWTGGRRGETYNGADYQEPNHHIHDFHEEHGIFPNLPIYPNFLEKLERDVEVKDCAYADGAEEADEEGLSLLLDLVDALVQGEDDG